MRFMLVSRPFTELACSIRHGHHPSLSLSIDVDFTRVST